MAPDGLTVVIDKTSTQILDPIYVADAQTLSAGGPGVIVSGTLVSVQPGGESIVIDGSTTENISSLLRGMPPSVSGSEGPPSINPSSTHGAVFASSSRKNEQKRGIRWQVLLLIMVIYSAFG